GSSRPVTGPAPCRGNQAISLRVLILTRPSLAGSLLAALESEGVRAESTPHPASADLKIRAGGYDVVFLSRDYFPGLDFSWLKRWRRDGVTAHILVLFAGDGDSADKIRALEAGADGYLSLPVPAGELAARLRALGRRSRRSDASVLRVHDLEIDLL